MFSHPRPTAYVLLLNIGCIGSCNFVVERPRKNVRKMSVFLQDDRRKCRVFECDNEYIDSSADIQKYARKRIQHEFEERIDKSVPWVTVWRHSVEPRYAKQ